MKIVVAYPPNIETIRKVFTIPDTAVFAYGDTIYNPNGGTVDKALIAHEEVHERQQGDNPEDWWARYLVEPAFRVAQEIEAYQVQYEVLSTIIKGKNRLHSILVRLAKDLSGPQYGNCMSLSDAMKAIKSKQRYVFDVPND